MGTEPAKMNPKGVHAAFWHLRWGLPGIEPLGTISLGVGGGGESKAGRFGSWEWWADFGKSTLFMWGFYPPLPPHPH